MSLGLFISVDVSKEMQRTVWPGVPNCFILIMLIVLSLGDQ